MEHPKQLKDFFREGREGLFPNKILKRPLLIMYGVSDPPPHNQNRARVDPCGFGGNL